MARVEVKVKRHPEPGEVPSSALELTSVPPNYEDLVYVVHATTGPDGDRAAVAREATLSAIDLINHETSRVVTIVDPRDSTYLQPGTQVTDLRLDANHHWWVKKGDLLPSVKSTTLIGGKLERCLGAVAEGIVRQRDQTNPSEVIELRLPLEAIYTQDRLSALTALQYYLSQTDSPLEAVVALLTIPSSPSGIIWERLFEIIDSSGRNHYEIELNGQHIGSLVPLPEKPFVPQSSNNDPDDGFTPRIIWTPPASRVPTAPIKLVLTGDLSREVDIPDDLSNYKIKYARKVLEKYGIETTERASSQDTSNEGDAKIETTQGNLMREAVAELSVGPDRGLVERVLRALRLWREKGN